MEFSEESRGSREEDLGWTSEGWSCRARKKVSSRKQNMQLGKDSKIKLIILAEDQKGSFPQNN